MRPRASSPNRRREVAITITIMWALSFRFFHWVCMSLLFSMVAGSRGIRYAAFDIRSVEIPCNRFSYRFALFNLLDNYVDGTLLPSRASDQNQSVEGPTMLNFINASVSWADLLIFHSLWCKLRQLSLAYLCVWQWWVGWLCMFFSFGILGVVYIDRYCCNSECLYV